MIASYDPIKLSTVYEKPPFRLSNFNDSNSSEDFAVQGNDKVFAKRNYVVPLNRIQHVEPLEYSLLKTSDSK